MESCLSFAIDCDVLWKGLGVVIAGFALFIGSVYVLLAAVFGRWMGYLVLAVAFFGWMTIHSSLWFFGFWSQGPDTPTNLGPRGPEAAWVVDSAGLDPGAVHEELASYPSGEYPEPTEDEEADVQAVQGAVTKYLADRANEGLGLEHSDVNAVQGTSFSVDDLRLVTTTDGEQLAVAQAHFMGGGPSTVVTLHYDDGMVWYYSVIFLVVSLALLIVHIPLLDRAERTRKEILVGGTAPPWYGPA
jgi:hypothetical protein